MKTARKPQASTEQSELDLLIASDHTLDNERETSEVWPSSSSRLQINPPPHPLSRKEPQAPTRSFHRGVGEPSARAPTGAAAGGIPGNTSSAEPPKETGTSYHGTLKSHFLCLKHQASFKFLFNVSSCHIFGQFGPNNTLPWGMRREGFNSEPPSRPVAGTHSEQQESQGREAGIPPPGTAVGPAQSYQEAPSHLQQGLADKRQHLSTKVQHRQKHPIFALWISQNMNGKTIFSFSPLTAT